jgi:hypothetical protein
MPLLVPRDHDGCPTASCSTACRAPASATRRAFFTAFSRSLRRLRSSDAITALSQCVSYTHGQVLRDALLAGARAMARNRAQKWLSDDRNNPVLKPEDLAWARDVWASAGAEGSVVPSSCTTNSYQHLFSGMLVPDYAPGMADPWCFHNLRATRVPRSCQRLVDTSRIVKP